MVLARAVTASRGLSRTVLRRVGSTSRQRSWRQVNRRSYASGHGHGEQQSSEIPWIIGSLAVTVPAAGYLLQQGSKTGGHGHGEHGEHEKEEDKDQEEQETPQEEQSDDKESGDEESDKASEDQEPKADEAKDDESDAQGKDEKDSDDKQGEDNNDGTEDKSDDSEQKKGESQAKLSEDGYELPGPDAPGQINWNSNSSKGPGEGQKGERKPSEKKGEKDSAGDFSGAKHPYLDDAEKSKKGLGPTETAKIHGTVDPKAPLRGVGGSGTAGS